MRPDAGLLADSKVVPSMPLECSANTKKIDVLGHGASGIVYLAKDTLLNRQVAIKVVNLQAASPALSGRARVWTDCGTRISCASTMSIVSTANIVLDMEYVRGKNVQECCASRALFPGDALEIAAQTLDALQYAHEMQTVHRDIKPANILINRQERFKARRFRPRGDPGHERLCRRRRHLCLHGPGGFRRGEPLRPSIGYLGRRRHPVRDALRPAPFLVTKPKIRSPGSVSWTASSPRRFPPIFPPSRRACSPS